MSKATVKKHDEQYRKEQKAKRLANVERRANAKGIEANPEGNHAERRLASHPERHAAWVEREAKRRADAEAAAIEAAQ